MPLLGLSPQLCLNYLDPNPRGHIPVLLLHGLGANGESWGLQIPRLVAGGYRAIAPDTRGFGQTLYPGGGMRIVDLASDMSRLLDILAASPAHVIGISMGGVIALQLAVDYRQSVQKLILVNTFASLRPFKAALIPFYLFRLLLVHTLGLPVQANVVAKHIFPQPEQETFRQELLNQVLQSNPRAYRAMMRSFALFDLRKRLKEIKAPTLVVTGEEDTTVPLKNQRLLAEGIPGARQVTIPRAGHAVTIDQDEVFNRVMMDFLTI